MLIYYIYIYIYIKRERERERDSLCVLLFVCRKMQLSRAKLLGRQSPWPLDVLAVSEGTAALSHRLAVHRSDKRPRSFTPCFGETQCAELGGGWST